MKFVLGLLIAVSVLACGGELGELGELGEQRVSASAIETLYRTQQSDVQLSGSGVVVNIFPDDLKGSRHQKFLLRGASGHTLLVAHNIDLAPRIDSLRRGDSVEYHGEYEWNEKGGVLHWTHRDPRARHPHGWLKHRGVIYH